MEIMNAHVVVTGASRGIGAAIAREMHKRGATVTVVARSADALAALADEIDGHALAADLTDRGELEGLIARAEAHAPVDVLVNNAGIDEAGLFWEMDADGLRRLIDLNVTAAMELTRQALPGMVERGRGHIVNLSSMASVGNFPGLTAYAATKAALSHFSAGLRADLRGLPVGVTNVQVGFVSPTDMTDKILEYGPTFRAQRRFDRLALLPRTDRDRLASAIMSAVEADRRHVLRPRRAWGLAKLTELPRRLVENVLVGVSARDQDPT
ncbi:MAG: SDR family NAD(P)-dependent oxidoreductase [Actinobacteria bacterium]|nr:SDR family NAD(P)-dependent oxidoreductase [Thermoleophilia bacterium]MCB9011470.1 SDR family NAD(P)-dependent oxidoreductase [Actinomycetota bacterium]